MQLRSVLVIEDDISWQKLHKRVLGAAGFQTHTAATCGEGIKLAGLLVPDCIVLDFHLPDGDAVSVCTAMRAVPDLKEIPVIVVSSDPEAELIAHEKCKAALFKLKSWDTLKELPAAILELLALGTPKA